MLNKGDLEKELRKWREARARKHGGRQTPADRRTLRVNGQEVVVITKPKRALAYASSTTRCTPSPASRRFP